MSDTCPTCGAEARIVGETTKHSEPMAGTIVFTPAGKERQMMSRASSVEEIRGLRARIQGRPRMNDDVLDREAFDKALSEVGMHLSGRYEQMLLAHDAALRERVEELEVALRDALEAENGNAD